MLVMISYSCVRFPCTAIRGITMTERNGHRIFRFTDTHASTAVWVEVESGKRYVALQTMSRKIRVIGAFYKRSGGPCIELHEE